MDTASQKRVMVGAGIGAILAVSALVVQLSSAAFTATTQNPDNNWATGQVTLTDSNNGMIGIALFSPGNDGLLVPGDTVDACIEVTYGGTVPDAPVRLYANASGSGTAGGQDLEQLLDLKIGSLGDDCATPYDPTTGNELVEAGSDTVAEFLTSRGSFAASGVTELKFAPAATRAYYFTVELPSEAPDSAQGQQTRDVLFTWETQVGS